ncbi:MAG: nucleoside phosphorylase [Nanoarchaeota archaeon]
MVEPIKDSELVIVDGKVYHLRLDASQLARNIFLVGDPDRADKVADHFDSVEDKVNNREYMTRTGTYRGMPVTVIGTGIGTDNNEITLVEAYGVNEIDLEARIKKEGAKPLTVIRIGTSGGIQRAVEPGTLAISTYGLGLDNTGLFYNAPVPDSTVLRIEEKAYRLITDATPDGRRFKGKIYPYASRSSPEVVEALKNGIGEGYVTGITTTASGFFGNQGREIPGLEITIPKLQEHLATLEVDGHRVVNFEMESSLIFHLTAQMGYRSGTVCVIVANRPAGTFLTDYDSAIERAIQGGLNAMLELHQKS